MEDLNAYYRSRNTEHVATTDGVPNWYLTPVRMFRAAFPEWLLIDSPDYNAVCAFLFDEGYGDRQIAQILDFSFGLGHVDVLNDMGFVPAEMLRAEVARIEEVLRPHGLEVWRSEDEYGRAPEAG